MPQWAMPQPGSVFAVSAKPLSAVWNQNEWSSATARSNFGWAAAVHEVGKLTMPSFS